MTVFDDLAKSSVIPVVGLLLLSAALPRLLPNVRPGIKSAIKLGIDLLAEAEGEAEAELVESLIDVTMQGIEQAFHSADEREWQGVVQKRVEHFKKQADIRARRWAANHHDHHARYRRHLARLQSALADKRRRHGSYEQKILDYAAAALASEA